MLVLIIGSQYASRVVNYDRKLFIRLATGGPIMTSHCRGQLVLGWLVDGGAKVII